MSSLVTVPRAAAVVALFVFGAKEAGAVDVAQTHTSSAELVAVDSTTGKATRHPQSGAAAEGAIRPEDRDRAVETWSGVVGAVGADRLQEPFEGPGAFTGLMDRYLRLRAPMATYGDLIPALEPGQWIAVGVEAPS